MVRTDLWTIEVLAVAHHAVTEVRICPLTDPGAGASAMGGTVRD